MMEFSMRPRFSGVSGLARQAVIDETNFASSCVRLALDRNPPDEESEIRSIQQLILARALPADPAAKFEAQRERDTLVSCLSTSLDPKMRPAGVTSLDACAQAFNGRLANMIASPIS